MTDSGGYFATKLASGGAEVRPKTSWWPRHACALTKYILADGRSQIAAERKAMASGALEWELMVPSAAQNSGKGLMHQHVALEAVMANATAKGRVSDAEHAAIYLVENGREQTREYARAIAGFPVKEFQCLLDEHLRIFAESLERSVQRDAGGFSECKRRLIRNAVALARLTAEWF